MAVEEMFPGPLGSPRLMEAEIGEYCNGIFNWSLSDGRDDGSSDILMSHSFSSSCSLHVAAGSDLVTRPTKSSPIKPEERQGQCLACVEGWRPVIRALVPVSIVPGGDAKLLTAKLCRLLSFYWDKVSSTLSCLP